MVDNENKILNDEDFNILNKIESKINKKIPYKHFSTPIKYACDFGFDAENGSIIILSIGNHDLRIFPEEIFQLSKLKVLHLTSCKIGELPPQIDELKHLHSLNLAALELTTIPESIQSLRELEYLVLEINQLKSLPESIGNLTTLKHLYLGDNQIEILPTSICQLKNLEFFDISNNYITKLPDCFGKLDSLKILKMPYTVKEFPMVWNELKSLEYLLTDIYLKTTEEENKVIEEMEKRGIHYELTS